MKIATTVKMALLFALSFSVTATSFAAEKVKVKVLVNSQSAGYEGHKAMDGNRDSMWHTDWSGTNPSHPHWITFDLGKSYELSGFKYFPRSELGNGTIGDYVCYVGDNKDKLGTPVSQGTFAKKAEVEVKFPKKAKGRFFKLVAKNEISGKNWASAAEIELLADGVQFYAAKNSVAPPAAAVPGEPTDPVLQEYNTLVSDLARRTKINSHAPQTFNEASLIAETDKDPLDIVLRRTKVLLDDIQAMPKAPKLDAEAKELASLTKQAEATEKKDERIDLFRKAVALRRKIAFSNPLLDFDKLLFITRHRSKFNHMCDQFYGVNQPAGGSIYVLRNPFSLDPKEQELQDLLADAEVQNGRLKDTTLTTGSVLSPDLSFDGKKLAFAYVECEGSTAQDIHVDPTRGHWTPGRSYHVFTMDLDTKGDKVETKNLKMITDGTWNDFDPCWLPNGRIAFITERRGGYLRCGRECPTYSLFDMNAEGEEIYPISIHETNEWNPSVTHDGRIMYTRWDYIDRHGCTVHHPWITTPDGRDTRSVHGNFSPRRARADMELECRVVPNSQKFTATAAPHHGQAYGSLIMVDPRVEDDDAMAPVKRITPEVDFPESQGGAQVYGTAWPLSENYYLAVYDPTMKPGQGRQGRKSSRGAYGVYLVDAFGNKELIYSDPTIGSLSPMPLRARKQPPKMRETIVRTFLDKKAIVPLPKDKETKPGTFAVINCYDSLRPWPEGSKIKELRIVKVLPMTTPSGGKRPHETGLRLPSAGDSVNLCRYVIGTVPVEKDGSAYFVCPSRREVFFQALNEDGIAIQSMRSATNLQEGDAVTCNGCHEPSRSSAPQRINANPIAMTRAPSIPKPDVKGTNPFSYPQLIQPILDAKCVACHEKNKDKAFSLKKEPLVKNGWYTSYNNLARNYGFWKYGESLRTQPGKFGANASKLYHILKDGHKDKDGKSKVQLTPEELHRFAVWLDMTSLFYGVYEKEGGQIQRDGGTAYPTLE